MDLPDRDKVLEEISLLEKRIEHLRHQQSDADESLLALQQQLIEIDRHQSSDHKDTENTSPRCARQVNFFCQSKFPRVPPS